MVGLPYDDLTTWRSIYPEEIFTQQLGKVCAGFQEGILLLKKNLEGQSASAYTYALQREVSVAEAIFLHYKSIINQANFIIKRRELENDRSAATLKAIRDILQNEMQVALALPRYKAQIHVSDLKPRTIISMCPKIYMKKALNCSDLIDFYAG